MKRFLLVSLFLPLLATAQDWKCDAVLKNEDGCQIPGASLMVRVLEHEITVNQLTLTDVFLKETPRADLSMKRVPSAGPSEVVGASGTSLFRGLNPSVVEPSDVSLLVDGVIYSARCTPFEECGMGE